MANVICIGIIIFWELQSVMKYISLDSIAVSVFVVILVDIERIWDEQACLDLFIFNTAPDTIYKQIFNISFKYFDNFVFSTALDTIFVQIFNSSFKYFDNFVFSTAPDTSLLGLVETVEEELEE